MANMNLPSRQRSQSKEQFLYPYVAQRDFDWLVRPVLLISDLSKVTSGAVLLRDNDLIRPFLPLGQFIVPRLRLLVSSSKIHHYKLQLIKEVGG